MNVTVTPQQVRLILILGITSVAMLMGAVFFLMRAQLASEDEATPAVIVHRAAPATGGTKAPAKSHTAATAKTAKHSATAAAKKAAAARQTVAMRLATQHRLPFTIARALTEHRVVVAALVVPDAALDATELAEAKAAAEQAGVGFVTVNVLRERAGRSLAERLGVVETPAVIVYRRPAKAFIKLEGFADRDMVAQAVANAFGR